MPESLARQDRVVRSGRGGRCARGTGTSRSLTARGRRARLALTLRRLSPGISATSCATTARFIFATATVLAAEPESLRVILSEPLDKDFVEKIAGDLGRIAVYGTESPTASSTAPAQQDASKPYLAFERQKQRQQTFSAGTIPPASSTLDHEITFPIPLQVVDWATGERQRAGALAEVETRPSVLYARLFAALGDYAKGVEYILLSIAIVFAIIELLALFVGTKLTRTITSAVGQLYEATKHVNRADFSHRITVQSSDQLATLANSFNSMTTSIEKLVQEQKEKQRLEGELAIAQEVQAQLYPKLITQLETLEVHGFCRPARTVSGDYYDFLALNSDKLMLAVGDISGKGISAALLMATIYSAVRAYSIEGMPVSCSFARANDARASRGRRDRELGTDAGF